MKILKLILIYFGFQIFFATLFIIGFMILTGSVEAGIPNASIWSLSFSSVALCVYLYYKREVDRDERTWSLPEPAKTTLIVLGLTFATIVLTEVFHKFVPLPDLFAETFQMLNNSWIGILSVVILGPLAEESLFRGAIMRRFLKTTTPAKAILYSSLIFGIIHLNPVQVVFAFMFGLLLGWLYYKTGSLIPAIIMHVVNNGVSTLFSINYPDAEYIIDLAGPTASYVLVALACVVFALCFVAMKKRKAVAWNTPQTETIPVTDDANNQTH